MTEVGQAVKSWKVSRGPLRYDPSTSGDRARAVKVGTDSCLDQVAKANRGKQLQNRWKADMATLEIEDVSPNSLKVHLTATRPLLPNEKRELGESRGADNQR